MNRLIILFFLVFVGKIGFCQTGGNVSVSYDGVIASHENEVLAGAVITLHTLNGTLLTGAVSGTDGHFEMSWNGRAGGSVDSFIVQCSFIGYATRAFTVPIASIYHMDTARLEENQQMLNEVSVVAKRASFRFEHGSYLVPISETALSQLSSANDILKRLPLLSGDNGSYSVHGRGESLIFINKRQVRDPMEVQNLDASQIESVRIITDPGVGYPIGTKAVIELVVKQRHKHALGFTFESDLIQRERLSQHYTLRANYTRKRLSMMTLLKFSDSKLDPQTDESYNIHGLNRPLSYRVVGSSAQNNDRIFLVTNLNYDIKSDHSIGYYISTVLSPKRLSRYNDLYYRNGLITGDHVTYLSAERWGINGTLYYVGKIQNVAVDFQNYFYFSSNKSNRSLVLDQDNYFDMDSKSESFLYDTKLNLKQKGLGGELSYGAEWTSTIRKDESYVSVGDVDNRDRQSNQLLLSPFFSYGFDYKSLSVEIGLRAEWERRSFSNATTNDAGKILYNPKIGANYKFPGGLKANFSWQTYTYRPQYFVLSGISSMIYPFLYSSGNTLLKSGRNSDFHLSFAYKDMIVQLGARQAQNESSVYYTFDSALERINRTYLNVPTYWQYSLSVSQRFRFVPFWTLNFFGELGYRTFKYGTNPERAYYRKPSFFMNAYNTFDLGKGYTLICSIGGSRLLSGIEESLGHWGVSGSVNKFFLKKKLYVSVDVGQYLQNKELRRTLINEAQVDQLWDTSNRYIGLTVKYQMNSVRSKNKASSANGGELRRF